MFELFLIGLFALLAWFWLDSMTAREIAVGVGKRACREDGVQFLDDTVAAAGLGFGRDDMGRLKLRRTYRFEFSDTGDNRLRGMVVLLGREVQTLDLERRFIEVSTPSEAQPRTPTWRWEESRRPHHGRRSPDEAEW